MKRGLIKLAAIYAVFILYFAIQRAVFLTCHHGLIGASFPDCLAALWHGIPMDASVAGYLTAVAGVFTTASFWTKGRWLAWTERIFYLTVSILIAVVSVLDIALYGYWGFRLDYTPIFYFMSAPASAMASVEPEFAVIGVCIMALVAWGLTWCLWRVAARFQPATDHRIKGTVATTLFTLLLFIPIRGGVTVSTMNLSRAYFSPNQRLNHASVNPVFSLLDSIVRQQDFGSQYRYLDPSEAAGLFATLSKTESGIPSDTLFSTRRPDIYIIILESFSSHLFSSLGGTDVATGLDSIARTGVLFTDFHANSFRTDRALPSILSAFPSQPSMSLVKYAGKTEHLPSLPGALKKEGYDLKYYYGGDIDYANFRSYLVNAGFEKIVSDADFPLSERTGKWGAHDGPLLDKVMADAGLLPREGSPVLKVIQTSSSHEPFEVPWQSEKWRGEPRLNAFAYTDSCVTAFINRLTTTPRYDRSIVVLVPDHYGAWPENLSDPFEAHSIPLIITGGALTHSARIDRGGTQTDIAATLLSQLGIDHSAFPFSKDLLDQDSPQFVCFSPKGKIVLATPNDTVIYDCEADIDVRSPHDPLTRKKAQAWLQTLFDNISNMK